LHIEDAVVVHSLEWLLVGQAAREIGETPKRVGDLFFRRRYPEGLTFMDGGRRFIHRSLLSTIKTELQRKPGRPRKVTSTHTTAAAESGAALS
jgi:hypothetical protein